MKQLQDDGSATCHHPDSSFGGGVSAELIAEGVQGAYFNIELLEPIIPVLQHALLIL